MMESLSALETVHYVYMCTKGTAVSGTGQRAAGSHRGPSEGGESEQ